ncbi:2'-5' RNA ligase family protein [Qipengyuania nanhaisediminis]|uniref:2'-5' RNA ligase family protein n=1 Tax=Qipengyuania nanhaisediminis TaxID=604088 RepID=UPI0038B30893
MRGWAEGLRRAHFPPERNHLHAHVTLFHAFAPSLREELALFLPQIAAEFAPPEGRVTGLLDLGKGTAIRLESPGLMALRSMIADRFHGSLTDQDLHEPRLHITVQNKVTKPDARALQAVLKPQLAEWAERGPIFFPGLELHLYCGGPWEKLRDFSFRGKASAV